MTNEYLPPLFLSLFLSLLAVIGRRNNVTRRLDPSNYRTARELSNGAFSSSYKNRDCNFPSGRRARAPGDCALPRGRTSRGWWGGRKGVSKGTGRGRDLWGTFFEIMCIKIMRFKIKSSSAEFGEEIRARVRSREFARIFLARNARADYKALCIKSNPD